ncbi:unnamed protein product [Lampetra fluviatilis]
MSHLSSSDGTPPSRDRFPQRRLRAQDHPRPIGAASKPMSPDLGTSRRKMQVGHSVESITKGIWAWPMPHPKREGTCLLLLDTEGLGDAQKANETHDTWLLVMAMLLCNVLVYNTKETLDHVGLDQLRRVKNVTEHVKSKVQFGQKDSTKLDKYCPSLVICLRDFALELGTDGPGCPADNYMEKCFNVRKPATSPVDNQFNDEYALMCKYFKNRKCFTFPMPCNFKLLKNLDKLPDRDIDEDFLDTLNEFKSHILSLVKYKNIDGVIFNGELFVQIARLYVEAQQTGKDVCIEEARKELVDRSNGKIFLDAKKLYRQKIKPMETQFFLNNERLFEDHGKCMHEVHQFFLKGSVLDPACKHEMQLFEFMAVSRSKMLKSNDDKSRQRCEERLTELCKSLHEIREDWKPHGIVRYTEEMDKIKEAYQEMKDLGEMELTAAHEDILLSDIAEHTDEDVVVLIGEFREKLSRWQRFVRWLRYHMKRIRQTFVCR